MGRLHYCSILSNPWGKKFSDISKLEGNMLIAGENGGDRATTPGRNTAAASAVLLRLLLLDVSRVPPSSKIESFKLLIRLAVGRS